MVVGGEMDGSPTVCSEEGGRSEERGGRRSDEEVCQ